MSADFSSFVRVARDPTRSDGDQPRQPNVSGVIPPGFEHRIKTVSPRPPYLTLISSETRIDGRRNNDYLGDCTELSHLFRTVLLPFELLSIWPMQ
jgi:hypothetical protein